MQRWGQKHQHQTYIQHGKVSKYTYWGKREKKATWLGKIDTKTNTKCHGQGIQTHLHQERDRQEMHQQYPSKYPLHPPFLKIIYIWRRALPNGGQHRTQWLIIRTSIYIYEIHLFRKNLVWVNVSILRWLMWREFGFAFLKECLKLWAVVLYRRHPGVALGLEDLLILPDLLIDIITCSVL